MSRGSKLACTASVLLVALGSAPALAAQTGGVAAPDLDLAGDQPAPTRQAPGSGGARYHGPDRGRPLLTSLSISRRNLFAFGRPARISYAIRDRSRYVQVRLDLIRDSDDHAVFKAHIGRVRTGVTHFYDWKGTEGGNVLKEGRYRVRVIARDGSGNRLQRGHASRRAPRISFRAHAFPVAGPHSFGGSDLRFGASREGHTHMGQDIPASEGTPAVAPRAGTISTRGYDAAGAGNYLVLDATGEDFDYVFMHLQTGSLLVGKGDRVSTGEKIANVGTTGHSSGPHLHFEIWRGAWFAGGKAIDPLPALRAWDRFS
jgi:hypothetical protein